MQLLARSLKRTPVFSHLNIQQITALIEQSTIHIAHAGCRILTPDNPVKHHLLVLDGNIKSHNKWLFCGNEMQYCWQLQSDESLCRFAILSSATRAINANALSETRYLFIDGDAAENIKSQNNLLAKKPAGNESLSLSA